MSDITLDSDSTQQLPKRPTFLTVICILTWIGSGIGFLGSIISFFSQQGAKDAYKDLKEIAEKESFGEMPPFDQYLYWSDISNGFGIAVAILCITGAILMFQQKKIGFLPYLIGAIISVIVAVVVTNFMMPAGMVWVGMAVVALSGLVAIAFIIMYAVNLKHMR